MAGVAPYISSMCRGRVSNPAAVPRRLARNVQRGAILVLAGMLLCASALARERGVRTAGLLDLEGKPLRVLSAANPDSKFVVFIFARTDCPISNVYAPEINALQAEFTRRGIEFWLVFGTDETPATIRKHLSEFQYECNVALDRHHAFAKASRVTVTPEAAVYRKGGELLYRGRIDDRYVTLGSPGRTPTTRDLHAALTDLIAGRPARSASGPAVGCFIE